MKPLHIMIERVLTTFFKRQCTYGQSINNKKNQVNEKVKQK